MCHPVRSSNIISPNQVTLRHHSTLRHSVHCDPCRPGLTSQSCLLYTNAISQNSAYKAGYSGSTQNSSDAVSSVCPRTLQLQKYFSEYFAGISKLCTSSAKAGFRDPNGGIGIFLISSLSLSAVGENILPPLLKHFLYNSVFP